ncbi:MAG: gamma-glutamyl-gamma-aminobutyrate hydrolase family protein [Candidatus Aenigmarchaeota archaeon]|nr:gamma-glutamyl-gamma-aminobutyrate hydrolase family protein [Candidatus Aenigmarchaeota archaeon]
MILIIDNHSKNILHIKRILDKIGVKYEIRDQRSFLDNLERKEIEGIILSGGRPQLTSKMDIDDIRADIVSLLKYDVPVLGICEGHDIIAEVFGGDISELKIPSIFKGLDIEIHHKSHVFKGLPDEIKVYEHHSVYVNKIPDDFVLTASSEKNKVEAMFHKDKPIYTVQFHPERSGKHGRKILKNFIDICSQ